MSSSCWKWLASGNFNQPLKHFNTYFDFVCLHMRAHIGVSVSEQFLGLNFLLLWCVFLGSISCHQTCWESFLSAGPPCQEINMYLKISNDIQAFYWSIRETEVGESLWICVQQGLCGEFHVNQNYIRRHYLNRASKQPNIQLLSTPTI